MILITGSTGRVGSALLRRLPPAEVRAVAHSQSSRETIERYGAQAVDGDFDLPETLESAMAGCERLFLLSPPWPGQAEREKAAVDVAKRAGVQHVVAVSILGAHPASSSAICRWHSEIDEHLVNSGLDYTILRPSGFMQVHLMPVETVKAASRWYGMTGDGAAAFIDSEDVAAAAASALTSPGHTGRIYDLTGSESITMGQAAAQLSEALGREVVYIDLPAEQFHASLLAAGLPGWLVDSAVSLYSSIRAGHAATITNSVEELTGQPPRSYRQFLQLNKDVF